MRKLMPMGKGYGSMKPKNKKKIKMVKKIKPNKMAKRGKAQGVTGMKQSVKINFDLQIHNQ